MKRARKTRSLEFELYAEGRFQRIYGPRGDFGRVLISARPAEAFSFDSKAEWDSKEDNYDEAVLEGILDELFTRSLGTVPFLTAFSLERVWWHPVDGSANAFYFAAKDAIGLILKEERERSFQATIGGEQANGGNGEQRS